MTKIDVSFLKGAALAALFLILVIAMPSRDAHAAGPTETLRLKSGDREISLNVEIARTPGEHARGLMFRRSLADDAGMLFLYEGERVINMWMRNTYISLDMLFIAADGKIARIEKRTEPFSEETISSGPEVTAVLEIGGGRADALGLRVGDTVLHAHFKQ